MQPEPRVTPTCNRGHNPGSEASHFRSCVDAEWTRVGDVELAAWSTSSSTGGVRGMLAVAISGSGLVGRAPGWFDWEGD